METCSSGVSVNYQRIYDEIIARAETRGEISEYTEKHHIVMKALGGTDDLTNIAVLTAREHYLAHWLLHKIHRNKYTGAAWAAMTSNKNGSRYVSRTWALAREAGVQSHIGSKRSLESREKMRIAALGRTHSEESKRKMSISRTGNLNHFYGKNHTEETRELLRELKVDKGNAVMATCISTGETFIFPNASAAVRDTRDIGRDSSAISKACRGINTHHNKFFWSYADQI
tara:strand:+ start:421 stop:1107 length:687 start_codon:yes stop_codon:yes gene_type:complete